MAVLAHEVTPLWTQAASAAASAFLASFVEAVEALTVVLAIGATRGFRHALLGSASAVLVLAALVAVLGPAVATIAAGPFRLVTGLLTLLFGARWLRKAILRAAGILPLHDEAAAYARTRSRLAAGLPQAGARWDLTATAGAFQIVMLEGSEVVFIVAATANGPGLLHPAAGGATAALAIVVLLGVLLHRPLSLVPENTLKFAVGAMLGAFGTFWTGEGIGLAWPGGDAALPLLAAAWALTALGCVRLARARASLPA